MRGCATWSVCREWWQWWWPCCFPRLHGTSLGSFDILSGYGLTQQAGVMVHNSAGTDLIDANIPWAALTWMQVHQGLSRYGTRSVRKLDLPLTQHIRIRGSSRPDGRGDVFVLDVGVDADGGRLRWAPR